MHRLWCITLILLLGQCVADDMRIGYLYDEKDAEQDLVFQYGIDMVNRMHILKPHGLVSVKHRVTAEDTFQVSQIACSIMARSIVGLFGPNNGIASRYVQSVCDTMEVPHVESSAADVLHERATCTINLHPHPAVLGNVFVDLVKAWQWQDFIVLYEDNYSLSRVQALLKAFSGTKRKVYVKLLDPYFSYNFRPALMHVKQLGVRNFIIDCSVDILPEVLKQVQQVGLMTGEQQIIIMNLDLHTVELSPFKYSATNITGVRLLDCGSPRLAETVTELTSMREKSLSENGKTVLTTGSAYCPLRVEHALIIDALVLFSRALKEFSLSHTFAAKPLYCNSTDNWEHGYSIINYMKMKTQDGLTGEIKFDHQGFRSDFVLDVIELTEKGLNKVGEWNSTIGLTMVKKESTRNEDNDTLNNKTLTVIICLTDPYGMLKEDSNLLIGNDRFEGFGMDLIHELSQMLGFKYIFRVQEDGANGALNRETGQWDGMIREVLEYRADLAITDLTITSERESAVDFTHPFMNLGISVLYKKPVKLSPSFFSFTSPFSREVWFLLGASYFGVSLMLFLMGRLCPAEWRNPNPCLQNPEYLVNQFSFRNSFWFTLASLMQQGSEIAPMALSTRMVAGLWWFFTLIMVSTYQANLAASLTVETKFMSFSDIEGLADKVEKGQIIAGAKAGGATANFFRDSNDTTYQKIWKYMESHPNALTANNSRGVDRANKEDYAFLMESTTIEFITQRECNLTQVGRLLDDKGYGIAIRKNSWYRNILSTAIVKLQETGKLAALKVKWWNEKRVGISCSAKSESKVAPALNLQNLGGVFLVLVVGTLAAFAFVFVESTLHVIKESILHKLSLREELRQEFEFFFNFRGMVKSVRRRKKSICSMNSEYATLPYGYANSKL